VNTNLLIYLAIAVVLMAQAVTILVVRHLVRKWCTDVYKAGFAGGRQAEQAKNEPMNEAYKLGYDVGFEAGSQAGR